MKRRLSSVAAIAVVCLIVSSAARPQEREPRQEASPARDNATHRSLTARDDASSISRPAQHSPQGLGKKFWILWAAGIGLQIADVESTAHCLRRPTCQESNPLLGKRPTRVRMYAIKAAVVGFGFYFSQRWKRSEDTSLWWVPPVANIGAGGFAVAWNLSHFPPYPKPETPKMANLPARQVVPLPVPPYLRP